MRCSSEVGGADSAVKQTQRRELEQVGVRTSLLLSGASGVERPAQQVLYTDDAGVIKYDSCCDLDGNEEEDDEEEDWD